MVHRFMIGTFALVCLAAVATSAESSGEVTLLHDIPYLGETRAETLDAYLPPAEFARPVPAVVLIHGGGWSGGDKRARREINIGTTLASQGYAVFSISYLLNRSVTDADGGTRMEVAWPQNLYDCKTAVRYLRAHAGQYGIDPVRIARDLVRRLAEYGIEHQYVEIEGAVHSFHLQPSQMDLRPVVLDFLGKHLGVPRRAEASGETP